MLQKMPFSNWGVLWENSLQQTVLRVRGKNDRGYLTDFSVKASQSEIDQSSDDESNYSTPPQNKPSRNGADIDICRASKNVFDKDINFLDADAEKQAQSGKENSAANDLGTFEEIKKEKASEQELGPAITVQLAKVVMKYWSEESKKPAVVNKMQDGLKISAVVVVYACLYLMRLWQKLGIS